VQDELLAAIAGRKALGWSHSAAKLAKNPSSGARVVGP